MLIYLTYNTETISEIVSQFFFYKHLGKLLYHFYGIDCFYIGFKLKMCKKNIGSNHYEPYNLYIGYI